MIRTIIIIGFLSLGVASTAYAQENNRVDQLEKEIQELKVRVSNLESLLNTPNKKVEKVVESVDGWKSIKNWRQLKTGMKSSDVKTILGEPEHISGGMSARWTYPNGGNVYFFDGDLIKWEEPQR